MSLSRVAGRGGDDLVMRNFAWLCCCAWLATRFLIRLKFTNPEASLTPCGKVLRD